MKKIKEDIREEEKEKEREREKKWEKSFCNIVKTVISQGCRKFTKKAMSHSSIRRRYRWWRTLIMSNRDHITIGHRVVCRDKSYGYDGFPHHIVDVSWISCLICIYLNIYDNSRKYLNIFYKLFYKCNKINIYYIYLLYL